ncbi:uncharacterized protein [Diabrotica undecimpunctata]|uniref:uncharacterized protein n=1 Tax=Diabrotica undecimpunctata TaxID=50387 RepID=UPI003B633CC1
MTFDQHLNWKEYIKKSAIECQTRLNILKSLSKKDWGADRQTMLSLYRTLIRSKLDYGAIAYSSATESSLKILDSVHNTALCIVLGAYRTTPIESLYCEAAEPSLYHKRMYLKLTYVINSKQIPTTTPSIMITLTDYQHVSPINHVYINVSTTESKWISHL